MAEKITIVGCGPGSPDYLTPAAVKAVAQSRVLVGAQRLLDLFPGVEAERIPVGIEIDETLDQIAAKSGDESVAILVSGDPGIFSLAGCVVERFGRDSCRVISGVSSVQAAFAEIGLEWADAKIVSAHKEDPDPSLWHSLQSEDKIAVLAGRPAATEWIAGLAEDLGGDRRIFVCEDLTLGSERVREVAPGELVDLQVSSRTVVLIIKGGLLK